MVRTDFSISTQIRKFFKNSAKIVQFSNLAPKIRNGFWWYKRYLVIWNFWNNDKNSRKWGLTVGDFFLRSQSIVLTRNIRVIIFYVFGLQWHCWHFWLQDLTDIRTKLQFKSLSITSFFWRTRKEEIID